MVQFTSKECKTVDGDNKTVLRGARSGNNCYLWQKTLQCFVAHDETNLWHQGLGHMNTRHMTDIVNKGVVGGVPQLAEETKMVCGPCNKRKQVKVQHKAIQDIQSKDLLDLIHMDLMGPMLTESIAGKRYVLVLVDDFSRFTWASFIREKSDTLEIFEIWVLQVTNGKRNLKQICSDHGGEFQNESMNKFYDDHGINHQFSAQRTPNKTEW